MTAYSKWFSLFLFLAAAFSADISKAGPAAENVTLYTPYTRISVPPGESIDYIVDLINNTGSVQTADISLTGMPRGWTYSLKSGGWTIGQLSVLPGERKSINLKVDVPMSVNKGNYRFTVLAGQLANLPLTINVSEQGTYKTEFTTTQPNMQGNVNSTFTFNTTIRNRTAEKQQYALLGNVPRGWTIIFKSNFQPVTAVDVEANQSQNIVIDVKAPDKTEAGKYKIPVRAETGSSFADLDLEVVITGSYGMDLTTPTGLLSSSLTAGEAKQFELVVSNNGSSLLTDIKPDYTAPLNWSVVFNPLKIDMLQPGKTATFYATVKADKKAIPGDYVLNMEAKTPEISSKVAFRISVETPLLWGWVGILVTLAAIGSIYYLFRKYGRR